MTLASTASRVVSSLALAVAALLVPRTASANPACYLETSYHKFIFLARTLNAGTQYTIETARNSGDTVMHLMKSGSGAGQAYVQVMADDDNGGNLGSRIVYTPTVSGTYFVLVRGYRSGNGVTDIRVNGQTLLTQNSYGAEVWTGAWWKKQERIRATAARRDTNQDPMLFLASSNLSIVQADDDSGPNNNALIDASQNATSSSLMIFGGYPSGSLGVRLTIEPPPGAADADGDGVADSLEAQCGLSSSTPDTDHDTIPDALELFGNNGFSFSAGSVWGDAPVRRNVYVEIDTMNNSAAVKPPYPGFPGDVQYIFSQNGTNPIDVYVEPESSPSLPYSPYIAYPFSVCLPSNCQLYGNLKTSNFSIGMPERQPYFHYFVFGDRYTLNDPTCATGAAQLLSQDGIVTIGNPPGTTCTGRGPGFPNNTDMLGTFVHELGHNLNLTHNENNDPNGAFSVIHVSVMNYRYQLTGVPGLSGILASTYSYGNNSFAPCYSSPKYRCELDALAAYAQYGDATVCAFFDPLCDTDVNEWNSWITTDFVHGARNPGPGTGVSLGASGAGVSSAASSSSVPASVLASLQPGEFAPFHDAIVANIVGATAGPLKGPERDPWVGPVPDVQPAQRKRLVQAQVSDLKKRGLVAGKDFSVSADGLAVTQTCMSR